MSQIKITRALLSVYDKTGIVEFAASCSRRGVQLVSWGGAARAIADADHARDRGRRHHRRSRPSSTTAS